MNMPTMTLAITLALGFTVPLAAQDTDASGDSGPNTPPVVSATELKTYYFTPQHVEASLLLPTAQELYGRRLFIEERGGLTAMPVDNLQRLGNTIVIYDTEAYAQMLGETLHSLDLSQAAETVPGSRPASPEVITEIYKPTHIDASTASSALRPFFRQIPSLNNRTATQSNVHESPELGQLTLRDEAEWVNQMLALLEEIDQPEEQMFVTCLVIQGQPGDPGDSIQSDGTDLVPEELTSNLSKLVPFPYFSLTTMGMVRASTSANRIRITMDAPYNLDLVVKGYDPESYSLTVDCDFRGDEGQQLQTRTTLRAGEYTVLGATGSYSHFVVLKIDPLNMPAVRR